MHVPGYVYYYSFNTPGGIYLTIRYFSKHQYF